MRIGDLATRAGVTPKAIRFYEQSGLLPRPARTSSGYREYASDAVDDVLLIRKAQALGFSLEDVREILELARAGTAPCSRVLDLARRHIADIESKITLLQRLRSQLNDAVAQWQDGGEPEDCAESFCGLIQNAGSEPRQDAAVLAREKALGRPKPAIPSLPKPKSGALRRTSGYRSNRLSPRKGR